jgi:hypothetical protein
LGLLSPEIAILQQSHLSNSNIHNFLTHQKTFVLERIHQMNLENQSSAMDYFSQHVED